MLSQVVRQLTDALPCRMTTIGYDAVLHRTSFGFLFILGRDGQRHADLITMGPYPVLEVRHTWQLTR